jgi:hypothetical protein
VDDRHTLRGLRTAGGGTRNLLLRKFGLYAASDTARALARAKLRRASIVRSAWSGTFSSPRTRSGASPYSFSSLPKTCARDEAAPVEIASALRRAGDKRATAAPLDPLEKALVVDAAPVNCAYLRFSPGAIECTKEPRATLQLGWVASALRRLSGDDQ